jgi:hypothetical protein
MSLFYLQSLWLKFRYSNPLRLFFDALARVGVLIQPYYLIREGLFGNIPEGIEKRMDGFETGYLGPEDMKIIAAIPGRNLSEENLLRLLEEGKRCFGARREGELAAFTWFDLESLDKGRIGRPLKGDEAYLFDAYTLIPFRGMGIAPLIRYLVYLELEKLGKKKLYSISLYFNTPAVRFKKKLRARILELWLYIRLFRKWRWNFRVKGYEDGSR